MRTLFFVVAAAVTFSCGSAAAQEACGRPADTVATVRTADTDLREASVKARSAYSCGHLWSASVVLEKALEARPSVLARFNLATSYAATQRYSGAAELFRSVVADGQFTTITLDPRPNGDLRSFRVNAADEAAIRLLTVERQQAADSSPAAFGSADQDDMSPAGLNDRLQSIVDQAGVTGDRALFFDGLAAAPAGIQPTS